MFPNFFLSELPLHLLKTTTLSVNVPVVVTISVLVTNLASLEIYCNIAPSFKEVVSTSPSNFN